MSLSFQKIKIAEYLAAAPKLEFLKYVFFKLLTLMLLFFSGLFTGKMSAATKRRHVMRGVLSEELEPPKENQEIVKIRASMGNNLHEIETSSGETYLISMPTKFRKNVWVKRGDFVLVEPIAEGDKVRAEMVRAVTSDYIRYLRENNLWPTGFDKVELVDDEDHGNPNRRPVRDYDSSSDSDSSEEEDDD